MQKIFSKDQFDLSKRILSEEKLKVIKDMTSFDSICVNFMDDLWIYSPMDRVVNRFCKRSLKDRFSFRFWKKTIVFKNDPLVLNF